MRLPPSLNGHASHASVLEPRALRLTKADRLLVLAPHPDDETLAMGGLLQVARAHDATVRVICLTSGQNNPWAQRAWELRWRIGAADQQRWGGLREGEALASLERLGVPAERVTFLGWPDQGLTDWLLSGGDEAIDLLIAEIAGYRPTVLVAPSICEVHPDHNAAGVMTRSAIRRLGSSAPAISLAFVVHSSGECAPRSAYEVALGPDETETKRRAILCHRSQLRLRRGFMMSFGRRPERFDVIENGRPPEAGQTVRVLDVASNRIRISVKHPLRTIFGRAELLTVLDSKDGLRAYSIALEAGPRPVVDRASARIAGTAQVTYAAGQFEVAFPLSLPRETSVDAYLKLDRPLLRKWGFFDHSGWCHAVLASPATRARDHASFADVPREDPVSA